MTKQSAAGPSVLAPVLGARQDGSARVDTSRAILMTLLGEFVRPSGGSAWTQTLTAALATQGIRDKAARQALSRLEGKGWLTRERIGRQTRWGLTPLSSNLLEAGAQRIYGFGSATRTWDGRWILILAPVPEQDRAVRYRLSTGLNWAGFGSIGPGLWVSPWTAHEDAATTLLTDLGVAATTFVSELGDLGSPVAVAAQAWDLQAIRDRYENVLTDSAKLSEQIEGEAIEPVAAVGELTALVHQWRRLPLIDPELPAEILPTDWPGREAAKRFAALRAVLVPVANDWWTQKEHEHNQQRSRH